MPKREDMSKDELIEVIKTLESANEEAYDIGYLEGAGDAHNITEVAEDLEQAHEQIGNLLIYDKDE